MSCLLCGDEVVGTSPDVRCQRCGRVLSAPPGASEPQPEEAEPEPAGGAAAPARVPPSEPADGPDERLIARIQTRSRWARWSELKERLGAEIGQIFGHQESAPPAAGQEEDDGRYLIVRGARIEEETAPRRQVARVGGGPKGADAPPTGVISHVARLGGGAPPDAPEAPAELGEARPGDGPPRKVSPAVAISALIAACAGLAFLVWQTPEAPPVSRGGGGPAVAEAPAPMAEPGAGPAAVAVGPERPPAPAKPASVTPREVPKRVATAPARPAALPTDVDAVGAGGAEADLDDDEDEALDEAMDDEIAEEMAEIESMSRADLVPQALAEPGEEAAPAEAYEGPEAPPGAEPADLTGIRVTVRSVTPYEDRAVVQGVVTNVGQSPVAGVRWRVRLTDAGRPVGEAVVGCCTAMDDSEVAAMAEAETWEALAPEGAVLEARSGLPFTAAVRLGEGGDGHLAAWVQPVAGFVP